MDEVNVVLRCCSGASVSLNMEGINMPRISLDFQKAYLKIKAKWWIEVSGPAQMWVQDFGSLLHSSAL